MGLHIIRHELPAPEQTVSSGSLATKVYDDDDSGKAQPSLISGTSCIMVIRDHD